MVLLYSDKNSFKIFISVLSFAKFIIQWWPFRISNSYKNWKFWKGLSNDNSSTVWIQSNFQFLRTKKLNFPLRFYFKTLFSNSGHLEFLIYTKKIFCKGPSIQGTFQVSIDNIWSYVNTLPCSGGHIYFPIDKKKRHKLFRGS